jgi:hypothetical protein
LNGYQEILFTALWYPTQPAVSTLRQIIVGCLMAKFITKPTGGKRRKKRLPQVISDITPASAQLPPARVNRPKPIIKVHAAPIISRLPQMTSVETMRVWINALHIQDDKARTREARREAELVVEAIEEVWKCRSSGHLPDGWFQWPDTRASRGDGSLSGEDWLDLGPLKFLGYTVGRDGCGEGLRWSILRRVFQGVLPPVFPVPYLSEWGSPGSPKRLSKIAESIASFARSKKRHDSERFAQAIQDWENDLRHLYQVYYVGRFGFGWPRI